ncbi:flavodoxin family protein [Patescibacteria group bacterium]|nr:flavodoxin family protein [Patescibacteria group bacterium]
MKTVIYDSTFGNTEKIARAIAEGADAKVIHIKDAQSLDIKTMELLIVGSPTLGGRPSKPVQDFLNALPADALKNTRVAGFDTRFEESAQGFGLKLILKTFKYAGEKILKSLESKGGQAVSAEGFYVTGKEGPLKEGEIERAKEWGRSLV